MKIFAQSIYLTLLCQTKLINQMKKQEHFLKNKFLEFCNKKYPNDTTNDNILAGECEVSEATIRNWADPTLSSTPKLIHCRVLCKLADIDYNQFISEFIYLP